MNQVTQKLYGATWFLMALCVFGMVPGCSSISVEYPQDEIDAIKDSLPDTVLIVEVEKPEDYPADIAMHGAYTKLDVMDGINIIYTIKGNLCLMEHEATHVFDGPGHKDWPKRLMECEV